MTDRALCVGFIGGGVNSAVGNTHFIASQMDAKFRVESGCFSRSEAVNSKTGEVRGINPDRIYSTWEELIASEADRLDAVVVLTPTPYHVEPVIAALRANLPVICEKALASTSKEVLAIADVQQETGGFLAVTYNYTGYPMLRELKYIIAKNTLGRIEQIHVEMPQEGFARLDRNGRPMVPQQWRLADGSIPTLSLDLGVHLHNLVDFLTGSKPASLVASQRSFGQFRQVIDNAMALVRYEDGMEGCFWFSKSALGYRNGLKVRVFGDQGSAEWYQMNPEMLILSDNKGQRLTLDRGSAETNIVHQDRYNRFKSGHPAGFVEAFGNLYYDLSQSINAWRRHLPQNPDYVFTVRHAWEGMVMLEAMERSSAEGRWVNIDLRF